MSLATQVIGNILLEKNEGLDDYITSLVNISESVKENQDGKKQ